MDCYERVCWSQRQTPRDLVNFCRSPEFNQLWISDYAAIAMDLADRLERALDRDEFEAAALEFDPDQPPIPAEACTDMRGLGCARRRHKPPTEAELAGAWEPAQMIKSTHSPEVAP